MSKPLKRTGARKGRVRAEGEYADGSYFKNNGPMEVMDGQGYRPDPAIHSTDTDPGMPKPKAPEVSKKPGSTEDDRNRVLTSPLPLVVSAPEAIEKMEMLNDLIKEGRPDLGPESDAVHQAIDNLERKAMGDQDYVQHEMAEGEMGAQGQPGMSQFKVGDRVVMALDDGEYQGEIQTDNGDGTFDVKTDQMATFRRVPAESIAKPEMLQPIASKEKKMKKALRPKAAKVEDVDPNPDNSAIAERVTEILRANPGLGEAAAKAQAKDELKLKKVGAVVKASSEVGKTYLESDQEEPFSFRVVDKGTGKEMSEKYPKAWEEAKTQMSNDQWAGFMRQPTCVVLYEGFAPDDLSIVGENYVNGCEETDSFNANRKVKAGVGLKEGDTLNDKDGKFFGRVYNVSPNWIALMDANDKKTMHLPGDLQEDIESGELKIGASVKAAPAVADKGAVSPDINTDKAAPVKEGYKLVEGAKIVEDNGQPRAFKDADDVIPAELYANAEGKLALVTPDGEANYEESANDEVELAYWKTVHSLIPKAQPAQESKPTPAPAPQPSPSQPAKEAVAASNKKKMKATKAEPLVPVEPTAAEKLLADHKIKADKFYIVAKLNGGPAYGVYDHTATSLQAVLDNGIKAERIEGIFADKPAAERFYAIVGGKKVTAVDALERANDELKIVERKASEAEQSALDGQESLEIGELTDAQSDASRARDEAYEAKEAAEDARKRIMNAPKASKVIARGNALELAKQDETYAMAIAALKVAPTAKIMILASKDGVLTAAESTALYEGQDKEPFFKLVDALKAEGFMGLEVEYPGFYALYDVPGLPKNFFLWATPWFNYEDKIDLGLAQDEDGVWNNVDTPEVTSSAALDSLPFVTEDAPTEEAVAAYKAAVEGAIPAILELAKSLGVKAASDTDIQISLSTAEQGFEEAADLTKDSTKALKKGDRRKAQGEVQKAISMSESAEHSARGAEEALSASKAKVEASAFDEIPELEIGGGMIAKRKKSEKKEGKDEAGAEIEVTDKDGKVVATYPDAFGDDTVMIIKFLRQVLDIKETDDKKAGKAEEKSESKSEGKEHKKEKGESIEDKPVILPKVKEEKASEADEGKAKEKEKVEAELKERANWMEARVADARFVVEAMLRKGHVVAIQDDVDLELLAGKTLRQAQEVAARKAVDRKVMDLLAKPEAELRVIKASLAHLAVRQVRVQASEGDFALSNLSAAGLIYDQPKKSSNIGTALTAAFRR